MNTQLMLLWDKLTIYCSQELWVFISGSCNRKGREGREERGGEKKIKNAHTDKPFILKLSLKWDEWLCLFGWRPWIWLILLHFLAPCMPATWGLDPVMPPLCCGMGPCQEPALGGRSLSDSRGWTHGLKPTSNPCSHTVQQHQSCAARTKPQVTAPRFMPMLCCWKSPCQPKALATLPSVLPWIQK